MGFCCISVLLLPSQKSFNRNAHYTVLPEIVKPHRKLFSELEKLRRFSIVTDMSIPQATELVKRDFSVLSYGRDFGSLFTTYQAKNETAKNFNKSPQVSLICLL